jgi:hypothetical protein
LSALAVMGFIYGSGKNQRMPPSLAEPAYSLKVWCGFGE